METRVAVEPDTNDPYSVHEKYRKAGRSRTAVDRLPMDSPQRPGFIRFVCISDTHNQLGAISRRVPSGDVLLHCGDFTNSGTPREYVDFTDLLAKLPHKQKIVIAGNHEFGLDDDGKRSRREFLSLGYAGPREMLNSACTYLQDEEVLAHGYRIYGSPWHPMECFPFGLPRGQQLLDKWNKIPAETDILLTHTPPLGHGDYSSPKFKRGGGLCGCVELLNTVEKRVRPLYHVFGHIHPRNGVTTNGVTTFVNASICLSYDNPCFDPILFDLPVRE